MAFSTNICILHIIYDVGIYGVGYLLAIHA